MKYNILDNGGHPYSVDIKEKKVDIYDNYVYEDEEMEENLPPELVLTIKPKEIFIGKSFKNEMTKFSRGYGMEYDGNTILFGMGKNEYIFINRHITKFKALAKIIYYTSPVGNNSVPYPYAIDEQGNYYFFDMDKIIISNSEAEEYEDPNDYYIEKYKVNKKLKLDIIYTNDF
jgi:hypothetical protein